MTQKIIISKRAKLGLAEYLNNLGYEIELFGPLLRVQKPVRHHPDLLYCRLDSRTVFKGNPWRLRSDYPRDVIYNACSTGKFFIHNLKYTDPALLTKADELGLIKVDVPQGYARCSTCVVNANSIITYDRGIAKAARAAGLDVLEIAPGHVELPGYDTGFIGGTGGLVKDRRKYGRESAAPGASGAAGLPADQAPTSIGDGPAGPAACRGEGAAPHPSHILIFNGDLSAHPDYRAIMDFAEEKGVGVKFFADWKLTDIGSII